MSGPVAAAVVVKPSEVLTYLVIAVLATAGGAVGIWLSLLAAIGVSHWMGG